MPVSSADSESFTRGLENSPVTSKSTSVSLLNAMMVPIGKWADTFIELWFSISVAVGSIWKPKVLRGPDAINFITDREYNGFVNPRGLRAWVGWGTGAGWQSTTLEKPPPVVRVSWVCTRLLNFLIYVTNYTFQKFQLPSCLVFRM